MKGVGDMKVFLHTRSQGTSDWENEIRTFERIPITGEYLSLSTDSPWYRVQLVLHTPFPCDCEAEVYAVEVDHMEVKGQAFSDMA